MNLGSGRMIVDDFPALLCASHYQRRSSVWLVLGTLQMPAHQNEGTTISQRGDFQIRKSQRAHFLARVVILFVTIQHGLSTASHVVATHEDCFF